MQSAQQRLLARIKLQDSGCWDWTGCILRSGYGQTSLDGKQEYAHRAFYRLYVGAIPVGLQLDHLCRNRKCVNPAHLEPVTTKENVIRGLKYRVHREPREGHGNLIRGTCIEENCQNLQIVCRLYKGKVYYRYRCAMHTYKRRLLTKH